MPKDKSNMTIKSREINIGMKGQKGHGKIRQRYLRMIVSLFIEFEIINILINYL